MKKIISVLICAAMIFALCACGSSNEPAPQPANQPENNNTEPENSGSDVEPPKIDIKPAEPFTPKERLSSMDLQYFDNDPETVSFQLYFEDYVYYDEYTEHDEEQSYLSMLVTDPRYGTVDRWLSADLTYRGFDELEESIIKSGILNYSGYEAVDPNDTETFMNMTFNYGENETAKANIAGPDCYPEGFMDALYALVDECYEYCGFASSGYTNFVPNYDYQAAQRMSNAKWGSWFCEDADYNLYGMAFDDNNNAGLFKIETWDESGLIMANVVPRCMQNDPTIRSIYFIDDDDNRSLYRYDIDSKKLDKLFDNVVEYAAVDGKLYYTSMDDYELRVCEPTVDLNAQVIEIDGFAQEPYVVGDWLVYVLISNGESLHAYNLKTREDIELYGDLAKCVNLIDNTIYFVDVDDYMHTIDLITGEEKKYSEIKTCGAFILTNSYIYYYDANKKSQLVSMARTYMSSKEDKNLPFDTCYVIGKNKELHGAFDMSYIYAAIENGYIDSFIQIYNYFDGGDHFWLNLK